MQLTDLCSTCAVFDPAVEQLAWDSEKYLNFAYIEQLLQVRENFELFLPLSEAQLKTPRSFYDGLYWPVTFSRPGSASGQKIEDETVILSTYE